MLPETIYYTFIFLGALLRMRNVLEKICRENQNAHFMLSNVFFFKNRAVYEIGLK